VGWQAGDGWVVSGPQTEFAATSLDEDFCDYDEKAEVSVEVRGLKGAFTLQKK
jgi:hypothetical protein